MSISIANQLKALHRYVDTTDELAGAEVLEFVDNGAFWTGGADRSRRIDRWWHL